MLILYMAVLSIGIIWVYRLLAPEMAKPSMPEATTDKDLLNITQEDLPAKRIEKLETLLNEKNKNILLLQTELKIFYAQICDFSKVKTLLEDEIHHLREQNRIFRSELGMPSVASTIENK